MENKPKLHLRKQIIYAIPLSISLALFIFLFIAKINRNTHVELRSLNVNLTSSNEIQAPLDLSFLDEYNEKLKLRKIDNTVGFYAQRFKLDTKKAIALARELTNNYTDEKYLQTYTITNNPNSTEINPNQEAGIIRFIKILNSYPETFGLEWEDIHVSDERDTVRVRNEKGQIIMKNGMTFEQYVAKISNIFEMDPVLSLAIIYNESGRCRSPLFINNNNVAGMKSIDGWAKYTTLESGVISYLYNLNIILNKYQFDTNTEEGLMNLSAVYVNGDINTPSLTWYDTTSKIMNELRESDLLKY